MELETRDCTRPGCDGQVELHTDDEDDLFQAKGRGRCDVCGQHYEIELNIETTGDMLPIWDLLP